MKKRLSVFILILMVSTVASFSQEKKFSPEKFQADMEQFISKESCLTPQEAATFFPVYREMQKKQRVIYDRIRRIGRIKPVTESECRKAIIERDALDLELKQIQQSYHERFFSVLPPNKVYDVVKAEERFHRRMMKGWSQKDDHRKESTKQKQ